MNEKHGPKVLLLGWEYPPVFSGGLGIVTRDLFEGLKAANADVQLILPYFVARQLFAAQEGSTQGIAQNTGVTTDGIIQTKWIAEQDVRSIGTSIKSPYVAHEMEYDTVYKHMRADTSWEDPKSTKSEIQKGQHIAKGHGARTKKKVYGDDLWKEIARFAQEVLATTQDESYDIVHAQDWITAEAALQMKYKRGIPYVMHVHATQVDRSGHKDVQGDEIFKREQYAMREADRIVAVSGYTKDILVEVYGIEPEKIDILHNVYTPKRLMSVDGMEKMWPKDKRQFWVLFIGRLTLQKGPEYFLEAAKKVLARSKRVHFMVAGHGDMYGKMVQYIAKHGLYENVHMLGFITPEQRDALYRFTDCCVIPSVSEPFGLTMIEAAHHSTPLVVSKNCGANEVIGHKLETDFWDSDAMAEYILALSHYPPLRRVLRTKALESIPNYSWEDQARKLMKIWESVV